MKSTRSSRRTLAFGTGLTLFLLAVASLPAQQMVTETRDAKQTQDEEFAKLYKEWTGDPHYGSPLVDHLPLVKGIPTPKDILGYYIGAPNTLTYYADILKYYSRARKSDTAREGRRHRQDRRRPRHGRRLRLVGREHQEPRAKHGEPAEARRSARAAAAADRTADRDHQAAVPLDGRTAQRRNGSVRDADGARLSPRDRDVAAHHADPQQRDRVGDAGGRARRPRPQRRLVLSRIKPTLKRRPQVVAEAAVAGSCPTGASTRFTTTTATSTCR